MFHTWGDVKLIGDWLFSKSSIYEVPAWSTFIDLGWPGTNFANSPVIVTVDFSSVFINGNLSTILVNNLESSL